MTAWRTLIKAEPRLADLLREIRAIRDDGTTPAFCANSRWYGYGEHAGFKPRLSRLVGWQASPSAPAMLRTMEAYDVAYDTLYAALPDCRNCNCM